MVPLEGGSMRHLMPVGKLVTGGIVNLNPDPSALPGGSTLQALANGLGWWALLASLASLAVGAATWAIGAHTNNFQHAAAGRRAVLVSACAALVIGAAPTLISFLFGAGHSFH